MLLTQTKYENRIGLVIGLPLSGKPLVYPFTFAFHNLHPPMNFNVEHVQIVGRPIADARNQICKHAQNKNAKYVFFIDEDVTPPAHAIRQLIFHLEHFPKAAVAAGIYCHKASPCMPMVFRGNGAGPYWDWKVGEVFQCSGIGMGCAMVRVDALKDIPEPWFMTVDTIDPILDGVNHAECWTEDIYFCKKATDAGWMIIADGGITPNHWEQDHNLCRPVPYNLPPFSNPMRPPGDVEAGTKKIVDLGCGSQPQSYVTTEGKVLRVDIRDDVNPDFRCNIKQTPFATGEFDIVYSSHTLEHFGRGEIDTVLDEWVRIMKPDGELRLVVPNLEWAAQKIMNKEIDQLVMDVLYGAQSYDENYHHIGFTREMLETALTARGFKKFIWDTPSIHLFMRAWKNPPADSDIKPVSPVARIVDVMSTAATDNAPLYMPDGPETAGEIFKARPNLTNPVTSEAPAEITTVKTKRARKKKELVVQS